MATPVYLFTGFLDSGKTTLIKDTLQDTQFMQGVDRTLILCLEEGEEEYPQDFLDAHSTFVEYIENVEDLKEAIIKSKTFEPVKYQPNNQKMLKIIENYIENI